MIRQRTPHAVGPGRELAALRVLLVRQVHRPRIVDRRIVAARTGPVALVASRRSRCRSCCCRCCCPVAVVAGVAAAVVLVLLTVGLLGFLADHPGPATAVHPGAGPVTGTRVGGSPGPRGGAGSPVPKLPPDALEAPSRAPSAEPPAAPELARSSRRWLRRSTAHRRCPRQQRTRFPGRGASGAVSAGAREADVLLRAGLPDLVPAREVGLIGGGGLVAPALLAASCCRSAGCRSCRPGCPVALAAVLVVAGVA